MLIHREKIWLIDHGAALYFHHNWQNSLQQSESPFPLIKDHVLLPLTEQSQLERVDEEFKNRLSSSIFENIVAQLPGQWLIPETKFSSLHEHRRAYSDYLTNRLKMSHHFMEEAARARSQLI